MIKSYVCNSACDTYAEGEIFPSFEMSSLISVLPYHGLSKIIRKSPLEMRGLEVNWVNQFSTKGGGGQEIQV